MSLVHWLVIAQNPVKERYLALSEILKENSLENQVDFLECKLDEFDQSLEEAKTKYDQIRLDSPFRKPLAEKLVKSTSAMLTLKSADALVKQANGWWPQSLLHDCFFSFFLSHIKNPNIHDSALIVGAGGAIRALTPVLLKMGYSKITITDRNPNIGELLAKEFSSYYFNVDFVYKTPRDLISLPGTYSLLINTTPNEKNNFVLEELYYFNFLKHYGVVVDLVIKPTTTTLLEEAKKLNIATIHGYQVAAEMDILWTKECFNISLNRENYYKKLLEKLS